MAGSEKIFENQIKKYLQSQGVYSLGTPRNKMLVPPVGYFEKRWGGMMTRSGLPDLHICIHGHSIECEIKAERGRPSELQLLMLEQINDSGGKGVILRPSEFEKFKELIQEYL